MLKEKKFFKFFYLGFFLASSVLNATMVNGISLLVNNEPITLYEIHKLSQQKNISLNESVELLIQKSLEQIQIKKLNITANSFEVSQEIEKIAKNNNMTSSELLNVINSQGISEYKYRKNIEEVIKNKKLFQRIFRNKSPLPNENDMKQYYEQNKDKFTSSSTYDISIYAAKTQTALLSAIKNPMMPHDGITITQKQIHANSLDKKRLFYLNQTPIGKFTPIIKVENGFISYLINQKSGTTLISYNDAKPSIENYIVSRNQDLAINNYFEKLKADAHIQIIRKP